MLISELFISTTFNISFFAYRVGDLNEMKVIKVIITAKIAKILSITIENLL